VTLMFVSSVAASAGELVTAVVVTIPVVSTAVARTLHRRGHQPRPVQFRRIQSPGGRLWRGPHPRHARLPARDPRAGCDGSSHCSQVLTRKPPRPVPGATGPRSLAHLRPTKRGPANMLC